MLAALKTLLKKIIPPRLVLVLRLGVEYPYFIALLRGIEAAGTRVDLMLGTPVHTNLGDHLITMAQRSFLNDAGYSGKAVEIPTEAFLLFKDRLKRLVSRGSVVFINGGGWMGSLWPVEEHILQEMVTCFSDNRIIIFPQTIYYDSGDVQQAELMESSRKAFAGCRDLTLCVRDEASYQQATQHYPTVKVLLVPDIALAYSGQVPLRDRLPAKCVAGMCLRKDRENVRSAADEDKLRAIFRKHNYRLKPIDTVSFFRVPLFLRNRVVSRCLKTFAGCSIVVTDRLHGMIFAFLTGTPCVVLNNRTNKVAGIYRKWLCRCEYLFPMFDNRGEEEAERFILSMANRLCARAAIEQEQYHPLKEEINHG